MYQHVPAAFPQSNCESAKALPAVRQGNLITDLIGSLTMDHQAALAQQVSSIASKTTYTGSGITIFFAFVNDYAGAIGVLSGIAIGLLGLLVNHLAKKRFERIVEKSLTHGWQAPRALEVINEHAD
jgi:cytochrome c biogenesis protein CcdA